MSKNDGIITNMKLPEIVLGGNVFGWSVDEPSSFNILDHALNHGINTIDTADIYSFWVDGNKGGESESIIGKWMAQRSNRSQVIVHTKGGFQNSHGEFENANQGEKYLTKAVEASLKRLNTDYIDLYYVHQDDQTTPPEETLGTLQKLIQQGKILEIGISNIEPDRLIQSLKISKQENLPRYNYLQTLYNLYDRSEYEGKYQKFCVENDINVFSYYSLAHGFLTGKYRSKEDLNKSPARKEGVSGYLNAKGLSILAVLDDLAEKYKAKPAHIALAWISKQKGLVAPVASATNIAQINDLISASKIELSISDVLLLNACSS